MEYKEIVQLFNNMNKNEVKPKSMILTCCAIHACPGTLSRKKKHKV